MQAVFVVIVFTVPVLVPDFISFIFANKFDAIPAAQPEIAAGKDDAP